MIKSYLSTLLDMALTNPAKYLHLEMPNTGETELLEDILSDLIIVGDQAKAIGERVANTLEQQQVDLGRASAAIEEKIKKYKKKRCLVM